jgi:hypothetical protein
MATDNSNTINVNGQEISLDDIAMIEVDHSLSELFEVILDAIAFRTAYAIDHQEDISVIARLAIANHFVAYSKSQVDKESGEEPTPGARGMTS